MKVTLESLNELKNIYTLTINKYNRSQNVFFKEIEAKISSDFIFLVLSRPFSQFLVNKTVFFFNIFYFKKLNFIHSGKKLSIYILVTYIVMLKIFK